MAKHKIGSTKAQLKQKKIQEIAEKVSQRMEVRVTSYQCPGAVHNHLRTCSCAQAVQSGQEMRVSMKEKSSGTIVSGEDAPLVSQMQQWLEDHPGWEPVIDNECESLEPEDEATEEDDETEIEHLMTSVL